MKNTNSKKGFTIIEVVLVLAIAGLIFLMVFLALPALQRSQHDSQRTRDYTTLAGNITNFVSSNRNKLPKVGATLDANIYLNSTGEDPNGFPYVISVVECTTGQTDKNGACPTTSGNGFTIKNADGKDPANTTVYVIRHADCEGEGANGEAVPSYNASTRAFVVYGPLEATTSFCNANQ